MNLFFHFVSSFVHFLSCFFLFLLLLSALSLSLRAPGVCVCFCKQCLLVHTIARAAYKIRYLTKSNCELFCLHTPRRLFYMIFCCCCSFLFLSILLVQFVVSNDTTCSLFMCCKHSSVLEHTALDTEPKTYLHGSRCGTYARESIITSVFAISLTISSSSSTL